MSCSRRTRMQFTKNWARMDFQWFQEVSIWRRNAQVCAELEEMQPQSYRPGQMLRGPDAELCTWAVRSKRCCVKILSKIFTRSERLGSILWLHWLETSPVLQIAKWQKCQAQTVRSRLYQNIFLSRTSALVRICQALHNYLLKHIFPESSCFTFSTLIISTYLAIIKRRNKKPEFAKLIVVLLFLPVLRCIKNSTKSMH